MNFVLEVSSLRIESKKWTLSLSSLHHYSSIKDTKREMAQCILLLANLETKANFSQDELVLWLSILNIKCLIVYHHSSLLTNATPSFLSKIMSVLQIFTNTMRLNLNFISLVLYSCRSGVQGHCFHVGPAHAKHIQPGLRQYLIVQCTVWWYPVNISSKNTFVQSELKIWLQFLNIP